MQIIKSDAFQAYKYKVIIGSDKTDLNNIPSQENEIFHEFLASEEDYLLINNLDSGLFLIKEKEDAEGNRKLGARVRAELNRSVIELAVIGDKSTTADFIEGFVLSNYSFNKYLKEKKEFKLETIAVNLSEEVINELINISKAVFWARDMVNEPVSFLTAPQLAVEIEELGKDANFDVKVLEKAQIEALKMGGLLAVNQGSIDPPTFTVAEYKPSNHTNKKPIVLVGKGVVYDTGGLSLKPTPASMDIMKSDMGGAACMAGAIYLAAKQKLPLHIIALIPATDNRPGLNAYAPGDIVKMYDGTTVEVLNTDAEGRMILADALAYSDKFDPEVVIDAATLTGAAHRAVGAHATIIMGNADDKYFNELNKAGNETYERVVRFPFWDEYFEEVKSPIADLKNLGGPSAGMITAGKFLEHFVKAPYVHMDIAGPAWLDKQDAYRTRGGSGVGVRLVYQFLKNYGNE